MRTTVLAYVWVCFRADSKSSLMGHRRMTSTVTVAGNAANQTRVEGTSSKIRLSITLHLFTLML